MRRNWPSVLSLALLAAGCAAPPSSPPPNFPPASQSFQPEVVVTQRGVLSVRGRQFSLNGYVAKSKTQGLRLVVMENFGGVLADVLVTPEDKVFVLRAKPPFRPEWVERYVAADLKCIFGDTTEPNCPVQRLSPTHFAVARRFYKLDLRTVETKAGGRPAPMFDEASGGKR